MEQWHLIVGLGNPGREYARTRHNAGFMLVEKLAERWGASLSNEARFEARVGRTEFAGRRVLLCEPQTFMNSSGTAVGNLLAFYRMGVSQVLVAVDDADLPLGEIRLRPGGGTGGHHGLESIEQHIGRDYARLRLGIGRQGQERAITGYVLGRFATDEAALFEKVLSAASRQVETWLESGIQKAMSQFNGAVEESGAANERKAQ